MLDTVPLELRSELILDVDTRLPTKVLTDPTLLHRILTNLAAAGQKRARGGQVVFRFSWDPFRSCLQCDLGSSPPSRRNEDTPDNRFLGQGLALGLQACDVLVRAMRGSFFAVEGTAEQGPSFHFEIPAPVAKNVCDWTGLTAIVMDQDPVRSQATTSMLSYAGVSVVGPSSVPPDSPPDLVLVSAADNHWETQCTRWKSGEGVVVVVPNHCIVPEESIASVNGIALASPIDICELRRVLKTFSTVPSSASCSSLGSVGEISQGVVLRGLPSSAEAKEQLVMVEKRVLLVEDNKINHVLFLRYFTVPLCFRRGWCTWCTCKLFHGSDGGSCELGL